MPSMPTNILPADITDLVEPGDPVWLSGPGASLMIVGQVAGANAKVYESDSVPASHALADLFLDLEDDAGADRAIRWALSEHAMDLNHLREDRPQLMDQCRRLAGLVPAPETTIPLPGLDASWGIWLPGTAAPANYDLRTEAHRDILSRWLAQQIGFGTTSSGNGWFSLGDAVPGKWTGWCLSCTQDWNAFVAEGILNKEGATVDARYAIVHSRLYIATDADLTLGIFALQAAIVLNPGHMDVQTGRDRQTALLALI